MYPPPAEGNFCHEHGNAQKLTIVKSYNRDTGYTDKNNHMANSYSISKRTWNWTRKLSPSRLANSEQFYSHHLLWCILTQRFQTCFCQGPNTRDHPKQKINRFDRPTYMT